MNESDTEMTEQPLTEPAVQPEMSAPAETLAPAARELTAQEEPPAAPPADEEPRLDNHVPLPMVQPTPAQQAWSSHDYEMMYSGLRTAPLLPEAAVPPEPEIKPEAAEKTEQEDETLRAAKEAYWKTALTADPDSIPDSFRARAASADITSSAEETEYDLLCAVNRSWYADHSEASRERILADWPRIRETLADKYGVADNEREVFTALSLAPEEEARHEAAKKAYKEAYHNALCGNDPPKLAPWDEEANPWKEPERQAREEATQLREELLPEVENLTALFSAYNTLEKGEPWELVAQLWDGPDMAALCSRLVQMEPKKREALYDITLDAIQKSGMNPAPGESLYADFRRSTRRGTINMNMGLVQFAGNLAAAAGNLASLAADSEAAGEFSRSTDAYLQLLEELRSVAQERMNPIHTDEESFSRTLLLDVAEASPMAVAAMSSRQGMALSVASGIGQSVAEARRRSAEGDISLQTAAGLVGFAAQLGVSELFSRIGGCLFEKTMGRFVRERLAGATGSFSLRALRAGGKITKETAHNVFDNYTGRGVDLLVQEGAARMQGVASNIDWAEYGSDGTNVELHIREAARSLPYVLIGSGRASLHHFRDPHAIVSDGAELTQWGVPEETQRLLYNETDPRRQNRILYDALHNGTRWGGMGFLEEATRALTLLHTDDFQPFRDRDVVRDFLQLPAETEAERARVLTLGDPKDPAYIKKMVQKHSGGSEITDPKKAMPFLLMTEAWTQRAYPEDLQGYPPLNELAPPELTRLGDYSPQAEKARAAAVERTVRYLDALTYRMLLNSTSYSTLTFSGRPPHEVGAEADALRHKLIGKVAESVLARAGGATQAEVDQIYGQFITDYYSKMRFSSSADSWIRFVPPAYLGDVHTRALSVRALQRGPVMRNTRHPELLQAYWVVQGVRNCVQSLVALMPNQADFRTALSRGMTPQEAYAHLLHRELDSRLPEADWFPGQLTEDATDREAYHAKNCRMVDMYTRLTGNAPESREGDDGRTYWRIQKPDKHYTRWHDSLENCINDMAADSQVRFLPLGADMHKELMQAHDEQGRFDAARVGFATPHYYSYYDRLSARATGDMMRFWQEDATQAVPGASVEMYRYMTGSSEDTSHPRMREHPEFPGAWQIDARSVRSPYGIAHARFATHWRNLLSSGWLSAEDAASFLMRREVIDKARRDEIFKRGRSLINAHKGEVTPARFFSEQYKNLPKPYYDTAGMQGLLAGHLADYTMGYYLAHLNEMPMPDSAREWFGLTPFRLDFPLYEDRTGARRSRRIQKGDNSAEQTEKWAHQRASLVVQDNIALAEKIRAQEKGEHPLQEDPLFPLLLQAISPAKTRSAEQGWAYSLGGANALLSIRPEAWNLLQEPVRGWSLLAPSARRRVHRALGEGESLPNDAEPPMPKALEELDSVLKQYPDLHSFALYPGDASRVVRLDIPEKRVAGYRRFDTIFDHPHHEGDNVVHGGFRLQEPKELPDFFRSDARVMPALHTMSKLRRSVHELPYADAQGVWWNGELYGGKKGRKLVGMDESWYTVEPMEQIRRIFREMPEDGSSVMDFGGNISFGRRAALPQDAFLSTSVYRSPSYPLTQVRLMPGERSACFPTSRNPYVTHSFIGAPMEHGQIIRNDGEHNFILTALEDFDGDVTREMIGHMAGWWGKQTVESSLDELMHRTKSPEMLAQSHNFELTNREVLMQLTEDCRFSASLEGRSPHELSAEEALAATWFHALAEYDTGVNRDKAAQDLLTIHDYFTEHPDRLKAVEDMLKDHRLWYELDPNDQWYHVISNEHGFRRANQLKREREEQEWKAHIRNWLKIEEEWDRADLNNRIGKPKKRRKE